MSEKIARVEHITFIEEVNDERLVLRFSFYENEQAVDISEDMKLITPEVK